MEKSPATLGERCGTYAGYKVHRKNNEELCMPCREAMREYRREYNKLHPEKEKQWKKTYLAKPEKRAAINEYGKIWHKNKRNSPDSLREREEKRIAREEKTKATVREKQAQKKFNEESRKAATKERQLAREAKKNDPAVVAQKIANQEKAWEEARERIRALNAIAHEKAEIRKAEEKIIKDAEKARKQEERERKLLLAKIAKIIRKKLRVQKERVLKDQHGVNTGDYSRCRKLNGKACDLCRAFAAKYAREKFHSDPKYREAEKRWRKANPDKAYANRHRAKKYGVPYEYYTRKHIFDRDGYDCYLCSTPVDLNAPHIQGQLGWELYPHIEHVIPISKGGPDIKNNVRIAHAKCNIDKGVSLPY
jgi:5-methylcytosine-specific restriction endonuclease McrA